MAAAKPAPAKNAAKKTATKKTATKKKAATKKAPAKKKYEAKTQPTKASVADYIAAIDDAERQKDCRTLVKLMSGITGKKAVMWGPGIVGFDAYHYKYESGHEGDSCLIGFAARKSDLTIYIVAGFEGAAPLLARLGRHRVSKACLYVKRLADIDLGVLEELLRQSAAEVRRRYP